MRRLDGFEALREIQKDRADARLLQALLHRLRVHGVAVAEEIGDVLRHVAEELGAHLHLVGEEARVEAFGNRKPGGGDAAFHRLFEFLARHALYVFAVHPLELFDIEARGGHVDFLKLEELHHLVARKHFAFVSGIPAQQQQVVEERLGQIAGGTEIAYERRAVALRIRLALLIDDHRQVGVLRHAGAERAENADVLEGVFDVVVAADDVGDALVDIVNDVGDVEDRRAVGAHDREVLDILGLLRHVPFDNVVILYHAFLRHAEHRDDARSAVAPRLLDAVCVAGCDKLFHGFKVALDVLRLVENLFIVI